MIPCALVHHTGSMIRFRTSQLEQLPEHSRDLNLVLPTGRVVPAHFQRNPANPNISGADLVQYIKQRLAFGETQAVLLEQRSGGLWQLHLLEKSEAIAKSAGVSVQKIRSGTLAGSDLSRLLRLADRENARGRRIETYKRVLRPKSLRRLMLGLVGARCMVDGCEIVEEFDDIWGADSGSAIVEVHHIEEVARTIDHHPQNLCVLCANHHRFVHAFGECLVEHDGPNVVFKSKVGDVFLERPAAIFHTD